MPLCAPARGPHAPAQLAEVLRTVGAQVEGPHALDLPSNVVAAQAALRTPARQAEARELLAALLP